jgi:outer membrane murein-binding lipoprotein Lpp
VLLAVIIAWLLVVGGTSAVVGVQGFRTYKRARVAQVDIEGRVRALEEGGLATLFAKTEELAGRTADMQAALDRLSRSLARLRRLFDAFTRGRSWVRALVRVVRG